MTILSSFYSDNRRIAEIWGTLQETSTLRNHCIEETKAIHLPVHPVTFNWPPTISHPNCWELGAQPGTDRCGSPPLGSSNTLITMQCFHSHTLSWFQQQVCRGGRNGLFPSSQCRNRGWRGQSHLLTILNQCWEQVFLNPGLVNQ